MIILRKHYTEEFQKEFGVVGWIKKKVANRLKKDISRAIEKDFKPNTTTSKVTNLGIENRLKSLASRKHNASTWDNKFLGGNERTILKKDIDTDSMVRSINTNSRINKQKGDFQEARKHKRPKIKDLDRFAERADNSDYLIVHERGDTAGLAHEIGHIRNRESKNPITRKINKISEDNLDNIHDHTDLLDGNDEGSILKGVGNYFKQKAVIREEKNASKKGLNLLKKFKMDKKSRKNAKKDLDSALDSYKINGEISYKSPIMKKLQTPSERKESAKHFEDLISKLSSDE